MEQRLLPYQTSCQNVLSICGIDTIRHHYPHYHNTLEGGAAFYQMRLPVSPNETLSFSLLFLQLRLPKWLLKATKPLLVTVIRRFLFMKFLTQDIEMMESEQRNYSANPERRYVEVNPAIIALQRTLIRQHEKFVQSSKPSARSLLKLEMPVFALLA